MQETGNGNANKRQKSQDSNFILLLSDDEYDDEYDDNYFDDRVPILSGCKTRALRRWILRIHGLFE